MEKPVSTAWSNLMKKNTEVLIPTSMIEDFDKGNAQCKMYIALPTIQKHDHKYEHLNKQTCITVVFSEYLLTDKNP
jgi:hypothetical protein